MMDIYSKFVNDIKRMHVLDVQTLISVLSEIFKDEY